MSGYGVVHRVTVYSGLSSSAQLFQVHSATGFANPYLMPPQHTGRRIEVPEGRADPGQLRFTVLDKRNVAGDQTDRFLTAKLGDADGRLAVRHSRVEYDVSDDGGVTFQREFTGRLQDIQQPDKNTLAFSAADPRVDEMDEMFDGTIPSVGWATPPVLAPLGIHTGTTPNYYGPWTSSDAGVVWETTISQSNNGWFDLFRLTQDFNVPWLMYTDALRELGAYITLDPVLGRVYAPDVKVLFRPDGGSDVQLSVTPNFGDFLFDLPPHKGTIRGVLGDTNDPPIMMTVGVISRAGDGAMPADGTHGTARLVSVAPPRPDAPILIGTGTAASGVHWATLVSGIAHGSFGGNGFPIDYPRFNELTQDTTQPRLRFRIIEGPVKPSEWLEENVWPIVGFAPAITPSGTMYPVSYDPPLTLPTLTFDGSNTLSGGWAVGGGKQYNNVRVETVSEQQIIVEQRSRAAFSDAGTDIPVDLLKEFDGDRIERHRDPDAPRKQFLIRARGLRPSADDDRSRNDVVGWATARAESVLDRFQDGPQSVTLTAKRQAATRNAMVGDYALEAVPWLVDVQTNRRGGTRVMLITEKSVNPDGTYEFRLLDNGPEQFTDAPTLTSVTTGTDANHAVDVALTPPAPGRAVIELATVASGIAEPASDSVLWKPVVSASGLAQVVTLNGLPSRRRHWVRTIGRAPGRLPSAYVAAQDAHTAAITPPTITGATVSGSAVVLTWTNGVATYPIMPVFSAAGSGVADGSLADFVAQPLPAGSTRFQFTGMTASSPVTVGVKHVDLYGGDSTPAKVGTSTGSNAVLSAPRQLTIIQGRAGVDLGQTRDPQLGYGLEVSWSPTEPYANTVLHYDTDENFTAPTAISGITNRRIKVLTPLDDATRYIRAYHQRTGYVTSTASSTVSAKPVALRADASTADGFAAGYAYLSSIASSQVALNVGTGDPDTDKFYYDVSLSAFVEPTTASSGISTADMPYSAGTGLTLSTGTVAYLWGKFWSSTKGFGQQVKHAFTLPTGGPVADVDLSTDDNAAVYATPITQDASALSFRFRAAVAAKGTNAWSDPAYSDAGVDEWSGTAFGTQVDLSTVMTAVSGLGAGHALYLSGFAYDNATTTAAAQQAATASQNIRRSIEYGQSKQIPALAIELIEEQEGAASLYSGATAIDGQIIRGNYESWAALTSGAGTLANTSDTSINMRIGGTATTSGEFSQLSRGVLLFDVAASSKIPEGAVATAATLTLWPTGNPTDNFVSSLVLTNAPVTSYTSLVVADYALLKAQPVEHGTTRKAVSSITLNTPFTFTLNQAALATLNSTLESGNVFELGLMFDWDYLDVAPAWVASKQDDVFLGSVNHATASKRPVLAVTYAGPSARVTLRHSDPDGLTTKIQKQVRVGGADWPLTWTDHITAPVPTGVLSSGVSVDYPIYVQTLEKPPSYAQARLVYVLGGETLYSSPITTPGLDMGRVPNLVVEAKVDKDWNASVYVEGDYDTNSVRVAVNSGVNPTFPALSGVAARNPIDGRLFTAADVATLYTDLPVPLAAGQSAAFSVVGYTAASGLGFAGPLYRSAISRPAALGGADPTINSVTLAVVDNGGGNDLDYTVNWTVANVTDGAHDMYVEVIEPKYDSATATGTEASPSSNLQMLLTASGEGGVGSTGFRADCYLKNTAGEVIDSKTGYYST